MLENNEGTEKSPGSLPQPEYDQAVCWIRPGERLRPGMICPRCHKATLEYDGLLQLTCPVCGLTEAGANT